MYFIVAKHVDSSGMTTPFHKGKNEGYSSSSASNVWLMRQFTKWTV